MQKNRIFFWLDDERQPPKDKNWFWCKNYKSFITWFFHYSQLSDTYKICEISLDHDLGEEKTGYDAICLIEYLYATKHITKPIDIKCHSQNPVGKKKIDAVIENIKKLTGESLDEN